jgi:hypothetical protein
MIFEKRKELLMLSSAIIIGSILLWPAADSGDLEVKALEQKKSVSIEKVNVETVSAPSTVKEAKKKILPKPLEPLTVEKGMHHEMQRVADIYEQRSKYAPYSLYLSSEQTDLINPNQSHESPRAYDIDGESVSILIKPLRYRFSTAQKIEVDIQIKSSAEGLNAITKLELYVMATRSKEQWSMKTVIDIEEKGQRTILAKYDPSSELGNGKEEDYTIVVKATFNGEAPVIQSAPIKIVKSIAEITGLGTRRIEGNDLIIPINITADKSGYYQVSASLFDVTSNTAISFLIAKERLSSGSNTLEAKVQGLVLRDKGFSGPFRLQGITLVKKSERPGMPKEYGLSASSYNVGAIDLNDFESIPSDDPMTEQRLEFMRNIGQ